MLFINDLRDILIAKLLSPLLIDVLEPVFGDLDFEMTVTAAPRAIGSAAWADALLLSFAQAGYKLA